MASQKVKIIVEFPEGMRKLTKQEANRLKQAFNTELANTVSAKPLESVLSLEIDNINRTAGGSSKKGTKGGTK